jgi:hypothetical protein
MTEEEADAAQDWKGMDGATAFMLIERHADGWNEVRQMMDAWLRANVAAAVLAEREAVRLNMRGNAAALEPVAWKWRRRPVDKWECVGHWDSIEAKAAEQMEADGWEVVRLYRAPIVAQAPATNADALDAA